MIELLSYQSIRLLNICELLITKQNACSIDYLEELNQCSRKTVYDDLELLQNHHSDVLDLNFQQNYVYNHERSISKLIDFKTELYHQELKINILKSIFCYPYETVMEHANRLNYSDSTIRKNIREMNEYLHDFNIEIVKNSRYQYTLESKSEESLRFFMKYIFQISGFCKNHIPLSQKERDRYHQFMHKHQIKLTEALENEAKILYYCVVQREKQGFNDPKIYQQAEYIPRKRKELSLILDTLFDDFFKESQLSITQEDHDLLLNTLTIIGIASRTLPRHVDNYINRYNYFYQSFKKENTRFAEIIEKYFQILDNVTGVHFSSYLHEIIFHLYTHLSTRYYRKLKIGVYSDLGIHHCNTLIKFVQKHFKEQIIIPYQDDIEYDLIISTTDNLKLFTPTLTISDYPNGSDIKNIYNAIYIDHNEHFKKKKLI